METLEVPKDAVNVQGLHFLYTFQSVCNLKLWLVIGRIAEFEPILRLIKEWAANGWFGEDKNEAEKLTMRDVFSFKAEIFNDKKDGETLRVFFANLLVMFGKGFAGEFGLDSDDAHQYIVNNYWGNKTKDAFRTNFYCECAKHLQKFVEKRAGLIAKPKPTEAGDLSGLQEDLPNPQKETKKREKGETRMSRTRKPMIERKVSGLGYFSITKTLGDEYGISTVKQLAGTRIALLEKKGSLTSGAIATLGYHLLKNELSFADGQEATRRYIDEHGDARILNKLPVLLAQTKNGERVATDPPTPPSAAKEPVVPAVVQSAASPPAGENNLPPFLTNVADLLNTPGFRGCGHVEFHHGGFKVSIAIVSDKNSEQS